MTLPEYLGGGSDGWIISSVDPRLDALWPGSSDYRFGGGLDFPLYVAMIQCARFAPALAEGAVVPQNWVAAQVLQARALVRSGVAGSGDQVGVEETVAVFPMDWTVKNLLRPRRGRPYFGGRRSA